MALTPAGLCDVRRESDPPASGTRAAAPGGAAERLLALQRSAGNRAVARLLEGVAPLPGGSATRPIPAPSPAPAPAPAAPPVPSAVARAGPAVAALHTLGALQRLQDAEAGRPRDDAPRGVPAAVVRAVASLGAGSPVPAALRTPFEASYGYDLDPVRVHTGEAATRATASLGARAVTLGDHVLLAPGTDLVDPAGQFVLGHELAHVVQSRRGPAAGAQGVSRAWDPAEREATAAALAALRGEPFALREGAGADVQPVVWWVLALIGLGVGALVAGGAAATGHGTEENREARVRENRGTGQDVLAWVPIAGSVQDIWEAESNLQLALGVGFLAFDCATLGGTGLVVRALARVPRAALRVVAAGGERAVAEGAGRAAVRVAGEEVSEAALEQAARQLTEQGGRVSAATATEEIGRALSREGAVVFAMEGGHAVTYLSRGGQVLKVHGGPLVVRFATVDLTEHGAAGVAQRAVSGGTGREGALVAYAVLEDGAPLVLEAVERLPSGAAGLFEATGRALFGTPTSCGIVQGAAIEASGLTAEGIARLLPAGGASGRFIPVTLVDHWIQTGAGRIVEGGTAKLLYGATGTVTQAVMGIFQVAGRVVVPAGARQGLEASVDPGPAPPPAPASAGPPAPADGGTAPPVPAGLDAGAAEGASGTPDLERTRAMERAALELRSRFGLTPTPGQVDEIRAALPDLVPGWLVLSPAGRAPLRAFLRSAGFSPATVDAILG